MATFKTKMAKGNAASPDLRDMLLMSGIGQYNALMSIPYMNMLPGTTEPYAQGVQQMIKGLQRLMNRQRPKRMLVEDGGMGDEMIAELKRYAGPRWYDKSWAQLYADVISGELWQGWVREDRGASMVAEHGELGASFVEDLVTNPIVLVAGAAAIWWKWFR